jgi:hypothetical protein
VPGAPQQLIPEFLTDVAASSAPAMLGDRVEHVVDVVLLGLWAYLECTGGVNSFRRSLGAAVLTQIARASCATAAATARARPCV